MSWFNFFLSMNIQLNVLFCSILFIDRENGELSHAIYLYTFVISDQQFQIPIMSMLSEVHHLSHILYFFFEFIRFFDDAPKMFLADMSQVLLNAAAIAFSNCANLSEYIEWLFAMATDPEREGGLMPYCYIRIDINHLVKNITTSDALKLKSAAHRQFLIRATCLLIPCTSIEKVRRILYSILVVVKSKITSKLRK